MRLKHSLLLQLAGTLFFSISLPAQEHSVAREWNEVLLESIRNDFARPTVHARNLFHISAAMYDAWAVYDAVAEVYLLGKTVHSFQGCELEGIPTPDDRQAAREEAISYAAYRLIAYRFRSSPGARESLALCDSLLLDLGYTPSFTSTNYSTGIPAALGNYIAQCYIDYGLQDMSNEQNAYANQYYRPANLPIAPDIPGNPNINDINRWQALSLEVFIDQSGQPVEGNVQPFLSPEWGNVSPFSLTEEDLTIHYRDGHEYWVYHDPGPPPYLRPDGSGSSEYYQWGFALVAGWSSHLDPADGVWWDISPGSIGNISELPESYETYDQFYDLIEGGDPSLGHSINPHTGEPYKPQIVPRGDYTRVLAEFWADGPDSETPPGHWFTILNYVNDHPELTKNFLGEGPELDDLEWDVKAYFSLGGAMHDAAISAWGVKGWYDYLRPVSAIRLMADLGQSSDPSLPNYHPAGIPLIPGIIEVVGEDDPLAAGFNSGNVGKIKIRGWRGPDYILNPEMDKAGVDWILAERWWPYQRPTFVTPPFAGYVSGHSTFSRAAAEIMTLFTGDPFFPGGMGEFLARKNEFLVFEEGPSVNVVLQWATYRDASDQTSLSRIWGGIHPPADDIPGRLMGIEIGQEAFAYAKQYFEGQAPEEPSYPVAGTPQSSIFPNPISAGIRLNIRFDRPVRGIELALYNLQGQQLRHLPANTGPARPSFQLDTSNLSSGIYLVKIIGEDWTNTYRVYVD